MRFVNNGKENPRGKAVYIEATKRFLQTAKSVEVKHLIIEVGKACALTSYTLRSPKGNTGICLVAEFFEVAEGKIQSNEIIFDMAAFREFMAKG